MHVRRVVHCRTGSLEIELFALFHHHSVHCRTGSLEILDHIDGAYSVVHCRTGSLEIGKWQETS